MKTIKQTVEISFKAIELNDAINLIPIMNILARACISPQKISIDIPELQIYKALKTLQKLGFVAEFEPLYSEYFVLEIAKQLNVYDDIVNLIDSMESEGNTPNYKNILNDLLPD